MAVPQNQSHAFLTGFQCSLSILSIVGAMGLGTSMIAQEKPPIEEGYKREELGVNPYTAPSIAHFQQLDELKPLPYEQLQRAFPDHKSREPRAKRPDLWRSDRGWDFWSLRPRGKMRSII